MCCLSKHRPQRVADQWRTKRRQWARIFCVHVLAVAELAAGWAAGCVGTPPSLAVRAFRCNATCVTKGALHPTPCAVWYRPATRQRLAPASMYFAPPSSRVKTRANFSEKQKSCCFASPTTVTISQCCALRVPWPSAISTVSGPSQVRKGQGHEATLDFERPQLPQLPTGGCKHHARTAHNRHNVQQSGLRATQWGELVSSTDTP